MIKIAYMLVRISVVKHCGVRIIELRPTHMLLRSIFYQGSSDEVSGPLPTLIVGNRERFG